MAEESQHVIISQMLTKLTSRRRVVQRQSASAEPHGCADADDEACHGEEPCEIGDVCEDKLVMCQDNIIDDVVVDDEIKNCQRASDVDDVGEDEDNDVLRHPSQPLAVFALSSPESAFKRPEKTKVSLFTHYLHNF